MADAVQLFVYGSLCVPGVFRAAAGSDPERFEPASLLGWHRGYVRGVHYPGIVPKKGARVEGFLAGGVTSEMLRALDEFEGVEYRRYPVTVHVPTGSVAAEAYVMAPGHEDKVSDREWNLEYFRKHELSRFLASEGIEDSKPPAKRRLPRKAVEE